MKQYNRLYSRSFRCRMPSCKGVGVYNLQEMSQKRIVTFSCPECSKGWMVEESNNKKACCGFMVVKFSSIEKDITKSPLIVNERVTKG